MLLVDASSLLCVSDRELCVIMVQSQVHTAWRQVTYSNLLCYIYSKIIFYVLIIIIFYYSYYYSYLSNLKYHVACY